MRNWDEQLQSMWEVKALFIHFTYTYERKRFHKAQLIYFVIIFINFIQDKTSIKNKKRKIIQIFSLYILMMMRWYNKMYEFIFILIFTSYHIYPYSDFILCTAHKIYNMLYKLTHSVQIEQRDTEQTKKKKISATK